MTSLTWTQGAVYCHDTRMDCGNCTNRKMLTGCCAMPMAVEMLLREKVPFLMGQKRADANQERSVNPQLNPWLVGLDMSTMPDPWKKEEALAAC